ncbi:MAG: hypothetical protein E7676_01755 [Ruminococcaceae bacterium]|nr:hypothetical protein [Oscillospiraceae bacterium]
MKIDLLHNKIVADTITPAFEESVRENLIPLLLEIYSEDELLGVQMYEDYIADDFSSEGYWYYPLTVITRSGYDTVWVKWQLSEGDFKGGVPYAYLGEGLSFELASDTPDEFAHALEGRALYCESGLIRIIVKGGADATKLSGRYSQTFIDELSRQITPAIEAAASVKGIADSSIELVLAFAPATYMDHISDNVTYRRLTMIDGASAPRDFWVKWTRLDGAVAYSISDNVWGDNILFELGEDVAQKVREKEYRYLLATTADKYHNAMSRSAVTGWRDLIKRAIKYGQLTKIESAVELSPETLALEASLAAILGRVAPDASAQELEVALALDADDDFARAMQKAREVVESMGDSYESVPEPEWEEEEIDAPEELEEQETLDEIPEIIEEIFEIENEDSAEPVEEIDEQEQELDELTRMALEALASAKETPEDTEDDEPAAELIFEIIDEDEHSVEIADEPIAETIDEPIAEIQAEPVAEEPVEEAGEQISEVYSAPMIDEASIRAEIEAKIRLEYENRARMKAEEEIIALRREQERLRIENEAMLAKAEREKEALRAEYEKLREQARRDALAQEARDAVRRAEEEKLRARIEDQLRHEARERERLAEAARMAIEEQRRLEAEAARAARLREEEERARIEHERRAAEEASLAEMRRVELERVRREEEERQRAVREAMPEAGDKRYTYVTRNVRLIFRRSVDPNITTRIHEIMKATMEYYGKEKMYIKVRASVPDSQTVCLEFIHIPMEEMELLGNIIKILGNSGLGIAKAIVE